MSPLKMNYKQAMLPYFKKAAATLCLVSLFCAHGTALAQPQVNDTLSNPGAVSGTTIPSGTTFSSGNTVEVNPTVPLSVPTGEQVQTGGGSYQTISGVDFGSQTLGGMLARIFTWLVMITIILAVIMLVLGGVQYMGSESLFGKTEGKERIAAALGGLIIALVSIFILNLILGTGGPGAFNVNLGF